MEPKRPPPSAHPNAQQRKRLRGEDPEDPPPSRFEEELALLEEEEEEEEVEEEEVEITEASQAPGMGGGVAREETDSEAGARNEATTERLIADLRSQEWRSRTAVFYNMLK